MPFSNSTMPEGPSIIILKELVQPFTGKEIVEVSGNSKIDLQRLEGQVIVGFKSWGKHLLICFEKFTVRIHLMLFGSYRINEERATPPRLALYFRDGNIHFYACSVLFIDEPLETVYDFFGDVMNDHWDSKKARKKLKANSGMLVCDALLDQHIFAGVGNIIKNEVLFRIKVHPESLVGALPPKQLKALIEEARIYSFEFLEWKKDGVLKKHWLAYSKKTCPRDHVPILKKIAGKAKRRSFFCTECQVLYT